VASAAQPGTAAYLARHMQKKARNIDGATDTELAIHWLMSGSKMQQSSHE
jgi:hypothetical protein